MGTDGPGDELYDGLLSSGRVVAAGRAPVQRVGGDVEEG
jgi:hypothetical protein